MNNEMNKQLISQYIDDELSSQERLYVERLLNDDKELNAYYHELVKLDQLLNERPAEEVSPDWEHNVQASLGDDKQREGRAMKKETLFRLSVGGGVFVTAVLVMLVVSSQMYVKRGVQGRLRSAADDIGAQYSAGPSSTAQELTPDAMLPGSKGISRAPVRAPADKVKTEAYEPYYLSMDYAADPATAPAMYGMDTLGARTRSAEGYQGSTYEKAYAAAPITGNLHVFRGMRDEIGRGVDHNTEEYARIDSNEFLTVTENPLSTFSIDVDTGAYSNVRRFLTQGQMPPVDAVRIEEMINYFSYNYAKPTGNDPFSINIDVAVAPWNKDHQLVRIGLQGKTLAQDEIPPSNLVFLIDVSGSMNQPNKLPLLKDALKMMVRQLSADQHVAIAVYAGAAGEVLPSTPGSNKQKILGAIDRLSAGGSTAGGAGIQLAYEIAQRNFIKGGNNRIILATDGDFNVGVSSTSEMTRLIEEKRKKNIFITVLGFGMGNYKDGRLEQIADKGNGTYYYIDTEKEARKVLVEELGSTLFTIAKDVKVQVEFNPAQVKAYRLIGYENRMLAKEDFKDDTKDAGELGAGHTVTALYEIVPAGSSETFRAVDQLTYQQNQVIPSDELMLVKLRYKEPDQDVSKELRRTIVKSDIQTAPQGDFGFAAAVAEFGMLLRNSKFKGTANYNHVLQSAAAAKGRDASGYRQEFIDLVKRAASLDNRSFSGDHDGEGQESGGLRFKSDETW